MDNQSRFNELEILELADSVAEDEFMNSLYKFETNIGIIELWLSATDGDATVKLYIPGNLLPVVDISVVGCERIVAVNDKRGQYLEIAGQHSVEDYSRGIIEKTAGFRVKLKPNVCIEPFYRKFE